jgi:hypothetical protein
MCDPGRIALILTVCISCIVTKWFGLAHATAESLDDIPGYAMAAVRSPSVSGTSGVRSDLRSAGILGVSPDAAAVPRPAFISSDSKNPTDRSGPKAEDVIPTLIGSVAKAKEINVKGSLFGGGSCGSNALNVAFDWLQDGVQNSANPGFDAILDFAYGKNWCWEGKYTCGLAPNRMAQIARHFGYWADLKDTDSIAWLKGSVGFLNKRGWHKFVVIVNVSACDANGYVKWTPRTQLKDMHWAVVEGFIHDKAGREWIIVKHSFGSGDYFWLLDDFKACWRYDTVRIEWEHSDTER